MIRAAIVLFAVLFVADVARAEKYVVELECVAFDRDLNDADNQELEKTIKELRLKNPTANFGTAKVRLLRVKAQQVMTQKCTLLLGLNESTSQKLETESLIMEAHVRLIEAKENSCKLDIQWGVANLVNERRALSGGHTSEQWVPLGEEQFLSGSGIDGFHRHFLVTVRKATEEDLLPKKLPKDFGKDIHRKMKLPERKQETTSASLLAN